MYRAADVCGTVLCREDSGHSKLGQFAPQCCESNVVERMKGGVSDTFVTLPPASTATIPKALINVIFMSAFINCAGV